MPLPLSALTADRRTISVPFGSDALTLTYRPSAINAVQEARELDDREGGHFLLAQARSLAEIIVSWDIVDEKGKPVAISVELISTFGLENTTKMTRAILDDLLPNQIRRVDSPSGSSAAASSEPTPFRTGT